MSQTRTASRGIRQTIPALLLFLLATRFASGISVDFDIQPRVLRVGEAATCSFTIRGVDNPSTPSLPTIDGFQASFAGTERSMSFGTGGSDSSTTFRYQLVPVKTGKFTIGPFGYSVQGQNATIPAIQLEVVAPNDSRPGGNANTQPSDMLFAAITTEAPTLFNQQVFDLYLQIYSQGLNFGSDIQLMNMPASGFSLQPFQELQPTREVVNNQLYDVRRFRCKAQALTAGSFRLEPTLRIPLQVQRQRRRADPFFGESPFDAFFGNVQIQPVDISTKPLDLTVQPLPTAGQPPSFGGAVGRFSFDVKAKPTELDAGEPITLTLEISGQGNLENITAPQIAAGDHFKVYESKLITKELDGAQSAGRKVFEQVLIPRSDKATALPAITFSFFDPEKKSYENITRGPIALTVRMTTNATAQIVQGSASPAENRTILLGTDIVYLKPAPAKWTRSDATIWCRRPAFLIPQAMPPVIVLALFLIVRRRESLTRDVARARRYLAPKSARAAVKKAEAAIGRADSRSFFEAVWEALASYFGNRLNLPPGDVTPETVIQALQRASLNAEASERVRILFNRCEQARFGMASDATMTPSEFETVLDDLNSALRTCERLRL